MLQVSSLAYYHTLKMAAIYYSETTKSFRATRHNIPEDRTLQSHSRENLKSDLIETCLVVTDLNTVEKYADKYNLRIIRSSYKVH
jgi:hypothetical protein